MSGLRTQLRGRLIYAAQWLRILRALVELCDAAAPFDLSVVYPSLPALLTCDLSCSRFHRISSASSSPASSWRTAARSPTTTSRRSRRCTWCCACAAASSCLLVRDTRVYCCYKFHLNSSIISTPLHPCKVASSFRVVRTWQSTQFSKAGARACPLRNAAPRPIFSSLSPVVSL